MILVADNLTSIRKIIDKLTMQSTTVLSEKVFNLAAEMGIGDALVKDCLDQLAKEKYISMPMHGLLKKKGFSEEL